MLVRKSRTGLSRRLRHRTRTVHQPGVHGWRPRSTENEDGASIELGDWLSGDEDEPYCHFTWSNPSRCANASRWSTT